MEGFNGAIFLVVDFSDPRKPKELSRWWLPGQWLAGGENPKHPAWSRDDNYE
jgi:hypothetical protein